MYILILSTAPKVEAKEIAKKLIEKKLVACVNIGSVDSIYYWANGICDDKEELLIMKTKEELFESVEKEIKLLHSYDTPEIIALPIILGSKEYLKWIDDSIM